MSRPILLRNIGLMSINELANRRLSAIFCSNQTIFLRCMPRYCAISASRASIVKNGHFLNPFQTSSSPRLAIGSHWVTNEPKPEELNTQLSPSFSFWDSSAFQIRDEERGNKRKLNYFFCRGNLQSPKRLDVAQTWLHQPPLEISFMNFDTDSYFGDQTIR